MQSMYAVNLDNIDELKTEYKTTLAEVEKLLEIVDPESEPYKSKYAARYVILSLILRNFRVLTP